MTAAEEPSDLIVLVADLDAQFALQALFARPKSLGIRTITRQIDRFVRRDPGCLRQSHEYLRPFVRQFSHALVVFDRHGCGREDLPRETLESDVEERLAKNGWSGRSAAIVLDPELEVWVWSDSPQVPAVLGWTNRDPDLRQWLEEKGDVGPGEIKPTDPKESLHTALRTVQRKPSASVFRQLAECVSLRRCSDPAFIKLKATLKSWFPTQ